MIRLLYVSRSRLSADEADEAVGSIIATSRTRNKREGICGALIFTGSDFAQVLEGPRENVDRLMADIAMDPRHEEVRILAREDVSALVFDRWRMAYNGRSQWVQSHVLRARATDKPNAGLDARTLLKLLYEMAEQDRREPA